MNKTQLTKKEQDIIALAEQGGNDASLLLLQKVNDLEDKVEMWDGKLSKDPPEDARIEKIATRLAAKNTIKIADVVPTNEEFAEIIKPLIPEPIPGQNYVPTEEDLMTIAQMVIIPTVELEKIVEKTVVEQPIVTEVIKVTNEIKEVAMYETAEQIKEKLGVIGAIPNITVSSSPPPNPKLHDLWVSI